MSMIMVSYIAFTTHMHILLVIHMCIDFIKHRPLIFS